MAGTYEIEVRAGELVATEAVDVRTDPAMPIPLAEQRARYEFTVDLYRLQADGYHAGVQANLLERVARAAADSLGESSDSLGEAADEASTRLVELVEQIEAAARKIRAENDTLRSWWRGLIGEFDGGMNSQGTMTGPTEAQRRRYEQTRTEFTVALDELDRVIGEVVPEINDLLRARGATPIEVPRRGGGNLVT